jgi:hypothetical protein
MLAQTYFVPFRDVRTKKFETVFWCVRPTCKQKDMEPSIVDEVPVAYLLHDHTVNVHLLYDLLLCDNLHWNLDGDRHFFDYNLFVVLGSEREFAAPEPRDISKKIYLLDWYFHHTFDHFLHRHDLVNVDRNFFLKKASKASVRCCNTSPWMS